MLCRNLVRPFSRMALALSSMFFCASAFSGENMLYIDDYNGQLGKVDTATGGVTLVGDMGHQMTDIAFDSTGQLWALTYDDFYRVDPITASSTFVGSHSIPYADALVFGLDGTLYAASNTSTSLFTINTATGEATNIGDIGYYSGGDLAFLGGNLYMASTTGHLIKISLNGGVSGVDVGEFGVSGVYGLAKGDNNVLYGFSGTQILTIDPLTGKGTVVSNYGGHGLSDAYGASFVNEAVPEPSVFGLLGASAISLIAYVWRRRG